MNENVEGKKDHGNETTSLEKKIQRKKDSGISFVCYNFKVLISWLGILHIYIWNPVIRIAIYLIVRKCYPRRLFGC